MSRRVSLEPESRSFCVFCDFCGSCDSVEMNERKQINFTIVPDDQHAPERTYANFCGVAHTPFDFTLTFCEVMPLSDKEIREAESEHVVRAPIKARVVMPVQFVPTLIAALQENLRIYSESHSPPTAPPPQGPGPVH